MILRHKLKDNKIKDKMIEEKNKGWKEKTGRKSVVKRTHTREKKEK